MMMMPMPMMPPPMMIPSQIPEIIPPGTPYGLEFLLPTNVIAIEQKVEWAEVMTGINTNNKYEVFDAWGRRMFFCGEDSDTCSNICCGNMRGWNINTYDCLGQKIMTGQRDQTCFTCCGNALNVQSTSAGALGGVVQVGGCPTIKWDVCDSAGKPILRLESPDGSCVCPGFATCLEADFPLLTLDGHKIGKVSKHFGDFAKEYLTNADRFSIEFPVDLDVKIKGVLLYATFLIDFMFYEGKKEDKHSGGGIMGNLA